jgi:hypothetical protein
MTACGTVPAMSELAPDVAFDTPDAALVAPPIRQALDCAAPATSGGLRDGRDLQRVDINLTAFPNARCNDGTGATFYVRPAATLAGRSRWVIQLQGGGGCRTGADCAARWCSIDTNFGETQMSSRLAPKVGIAGDGILYRGSQFTNPFDDFNQVFVRYCTSDTYAGDATRTVDAVHPITKAPVRFQLELRGKSVIDAVIATLRRDGASPPRYTLGGGSVELADLDDASQVVLAGASAGGGGVINNVDRIGELLRARNTACQGASCALDYGALIDSTSGPLGEQLDWSTSTMCATQGACTWQAMLAVGTQLYPPQGDASCATWHAAHDPATAYLCAATDHVMIHHLTTPMVVRQGLRDQLLSGNSVEAGVSVPGRGPMTLALFAEVVRAQMLALGSLPATAEEGAAIARAPGVFAPPCSDHETLSSNASVYGVSVDAGGVPYTMFDVVSNWRGDLTPAQVVYAPGDPVRCQ